MNAPQNNPKPINDPIDPPLELEPEELDDESQSLYRLRSRRSVPNAPASPPSDSTAATAPLRLSGPDNPLRWALDALESPSMAAADWLAHDIDPNSNSAADFLSNPAITLEQVRQAKSAYKTMRIVGEKSADRRVGARMYVAAIAAGLVRHGKMISTQSDAALNRGLQGLLDDRKMPQPLRDLAGTALCVLADKLKGRGTNDNGQRKTA